MGAEMIKMATGSLKQAGASCHFDHRCTHRWAILTLVCSDQASELELIVEQVNHR